MRIQTLSLVVRAGCGAGCPFCIARQTPPTGEGANTLTGHATANLLKAFRLAEIGECTTALITSKGEPLNNPDQVEAYIRMAYDYNTPIVELQTNGLVFQRQDYTETLERWRNLGLTTVAISCAGVDDKKNQEIYAPSATSKLANYTLESAVKSVLKAGLMCRLTVVMFKGGVDSLEAVDEVLRYCGDHGIHQVTLGQVTSPTISRDEKAMAWAEEHAISGSALADIIHAIDHNGTELLSLMHDAKVWDVHGVSVCVRRCLTKSREPDEIRSLIYWPDGKITYDWQYEGARLV